MSFTKKNRRIRSVTGKAFPDGFSDSATESTFSQVISDALHRDFGGTHASIKTVVNLTNANERAVKNWFTAKNGPSGKNLIDLVRTSDEVLEAVLLMSGRQELVAAKKFADSRQILIKMLKLLEDLQREDDIAVSTCIKCGGHDFEIVPFTPINASKRLAMTQCSACGTPIGVA